MNWVKFFYSVFLGSVITLPVMTLAGREIEEFEGLDDYLWIPILVCILSLFMKVILERKEK